jgi:peptidoglycan/LPS O-acetylase OafA/YrhL
MPAQHLKPLTSMRFFAAMWVVLYHYWPNLGAATPGLVAKGYLGVELFFVLSGFILCHVYLEGAGEGRFRYGSFLWARLARVYPLHLATLLGVGLMGGAALLAGMAIDPNIVSLPALPANLFLLQAWGFAPVAGWNHPSWSISAEWFAYLCFPAFAWVAWRLRERPQVAVIGAIALLFGLYAVFQRLAGFPLTEATIAWGALRIVPCFAYGCAVYLAWRKGAADRVLFAAWGAALVSIAILAFAAAGVEDAVIVSLFGLLILTLAGLSNTRAPVLSHPLFVWLGEVSYSVYMVCIPWKILFPNAMSKLFHIDTNHMPAWMWLGFVFMVIPIAGASHHLIERPAREALRRMGNRSSGERVAAKIA